MEVEQRAGRVLVSAGSRHGSTAEIAEKIAHRIRQRGHTVDIAPPEAVDDLTGYVAVVLGSAVYAGHWVEAAKALAGRIGATDPPVRTWIFSSGPIGDPPKPTEEPVDLAEMARVTAALDHRVFSGKIEKSKLNLAEKAILLAVKAPEGDFRDWDEIEIWAGEIADQLALEASRR